MVAEVCACAQREQKARVLTVFKAGFQVSPAILQSELHLLQCSVCASACVLLLLPPFSPTRFSSSDTVPLSRGSWAAPVIQVVEGRFAPDGNSFIVSDVAGQFSIYALGPPQPLLLSAPYDQFFSRDYDPMVHDAAGFAAYADPDTGVVVAPVWQGAWGGAGAAAGVGAQQMQQPQHGGGGHELEQQQQAQQQTQPQPGLQQPLCDNAFRPYPPAFQEAYRAGRVLAYVQAGGQLVGCGDLVHVCLSLTAWYSTVVAFHLCARVQLAGQILQSFAPLRLLTVDAQQLTQHPTRPNTPKHR